MRTLKLTRAELAALDAMIETLKGEDLTIAQAVPLRNLAAAMLTTVVIDATKVTGAGTRILPGDAKIFADAGKLIAKLKSTTSLEDLLELRKSAAGKKDKAS